MNWKIGVGVVLQALTAYALLGDESAFVRFFAYVDVIAVIGCVVGVALLAARERRAGANLILVCSVPFVPLGFLAIMGARQVLDEENEAKFAQGAQP